MLNAAAILRNAGRHLAKSSWWMGEWSNDADHEACGILWRLAEKIDGRIPWDTTLEVHE